MPYKAYTLSTNSFKKPKVFTDYQAIGLLIVRLLLMEPGTDPIRPEMGVGLISRYRFVTEDKLIDLRQRIEDQLSTYLPGLEATTISFSYNEDKTVDIKIVIDDVEYTYDSSDYSVPITLESMINQNED